MSSFKIGDVADGPAHCGKCGATAATVKAMGADSEGHMRWYCLACAAVTAVTVTVKAEAVKVKAKAGKKEAIAMTGKLASAVKSKSEPKAIGVITLTKNKETDNCIRVGADNGQDLFGSLYVRKDAWPKGAVGIRFTPEFIIG